MAHPSTSCGPLYSSLADDPDLADLVEMFVAEMPERVRQIETQSQSSQWDELRRAAHQLKGSAGSYGFAQLTPAAARLERALVHAEGETEILAAVDELVDLCSRLRAAAPR